MSKKYEVVTIKGKVVVRKADHDDRLLAPLLTILGTEFL
jgi:hypothetical protein